MRKIGIDLSVLDRVSTGTSVYASNLYQALVQADPPDFEFIPLHAPKPLRRKNILTKFGNFFIETAWLMLLLPIKARRQGLDLIHYPANAISPVSRRAQVCTIHDAHFISNPQGRDPLWRIYAGWSFRYSARHADRIICDSNSGKEEIVELLGAKPDNIEVIPLGLPHRESGAADRELAQRLKPYILTVGAVDPNKNLPALTRAYADLFRQGRHAGRRLVIAGPPGRDQPVVQAIIEKEGIGREVELMGRVSDSLLSALYENADMFVFPSLCEGFGFPPLEAMSYGVPVVASHAPCIPEVLGDAPVYFDPQDIAGISTKMHETLSDPQLREKMIEVGLARAREFSWEKTALKTIETYRSVLD